MHFERLLYLLEQLPEQFTDGMIKSNEREREKERERERGRGRKGEKGEKEEEKGEKSKQNVNVNNVYKSKKFLKCAPF